MHRITCIVFAACSTLGIFGFAQAQTEIEIAVSVSEAMPSQAETIQQVALRDARVCTHVRASISPDGRLSFFDHPLMRNRYEPWIGEPHRQSILQAGSASPRMLVNLDCIAGSAPQNNQTCAAQVFGGKSSPWSRPAWSIDSNHLAFVSAAGHQVAEAEGSVTLIGGLQAYFGGSPAYSVRTHSAPSRLSLPPIFNPDAHTPIGGNAQSVFDPSIQSDLIVVSENLTPIRSVQVSESDVRVRIGSSGQEYEFSLASYTNTVRSIGNQTLLLTSDQADRPFSAIVSAETGSVESFEEWPTGDLIRPVLSNDGSRVIGYLTERGLFAAESAEHSERLLFEHLNEYLLSKPDFDLYDISVDQAGRRAIAALQHQHAGREFVLVSAEGRHVGPIGLDCSYDSDFAYYERQPLRYHTRLGDIAVTLFRQQTPSLRRSESDNQQTRRAVIWMRGSPSAHSGFGLPEIWPIAQMSNVDIFSVDYIGSIGRDLPLEVLDNSESAWDWAVLMCTDITRAVRDEFSDEYDQIGLMGDRTGGLIALASLFETTCVSDFTIVRNPVLTNDRGTFDGSDTIPDVRLSRIWLDRMDNVENQIRELDVNSSSVGVFVLNLDHPWEDMRPASLLLSRLARSAPNLEFSLRGSGLGSLDPEVRAANTRPDYSEYFTQ